MEKEFAKEIMAKSSDPNVYQSMIEQSIDVIFRYDNEKKFTVISAAIEKILDCKSLDIIQNYNIWQEKILNEYQEMVKQNRNKALQGDQLSFVYQMHKENQKIWIEEFCYPIKDENGKIVCIQGVIKDITKDKLLEEQATRVQKMEALTVLAGGVAHDLKNILGALVGYPDLITKKIPPEFGIQSYVDAIKNSAMIATDVVNDLLTMAKKGEYSLENMDLSEYVNDFLNSSQFLTLREKYPKIKIENNIEENLFVEGSRTHIRKTIMNLVNNGMEAISEEGFLRINTSNIHLDQDHVGYEVVPVGDYVLLKITDTGKGISPENYKKIFEPFFTTKKKKGAGLGLAVVYSVVQEHRGYIDVQSQLEEGTCFSVYLPFVEKIELKKLDTVKKVLVVDDAFLQREMAKEILLTYGYEVFTVASGEEAVEFVRNNFVDLSILDMSLDEGINGVETYRRIKEIVPTHKAIVMSAYEEHEDLEEIKKLGVKTFIVKPFDIEKLVGGVQKELNQ